MDYDCKLLNYICLHVQAHHAMTCLAIILPSHFLDEIKMLVYLVQSGHRIKLCCTSGPYASLCADFVLPVDSLR